MSERLVIRVALGALAALVLVSLMVALRLGARLDAAEAELADTRVTVGRIQDGLDIVVTQAAGLFAALDDLGPTASAALDQAVTRLDGFGTATIEFDVSIDEVVPIDAAITLDRTLRVPISATLPIDETFDTRIVIAGPFGVDIPLNVTVPVALDVPIDLVVDIPVQETLPVSTEVPVRLDVPVAVDVAGTELAALAEALRDGLVSIRDALAGLR